MQTKFFNPLIILVTVTFVEHCAHGESEALSEEEKLTLKAFLKDIFTRIELARDIALFSWRTGKEPYERTLDRNLITRAKSVATEHNVTIEDAIQLSSDMINAGRIYVSTLIFNWYAHKYLDDEYHPYGRDIDIEKSMGEIQEAQDKVIKSLPKLSPLMDRATCSQTVSVNIFKMKDAKNQMTRMALQRSMGAFCKVLIQHS